jgi:bacterioferritin (cytochrome b1)
MSPRDAAKLFREKADMYLKMTGYARDEYQRRILHELFEENEERAEFLERMLRNDEAFDQLRVQRRMN